MIYDAYNAIITMVHDLASDLTGGDGTAKGLVIVGILGVAVAALRGTPTKILELIKRKVIVSVRVENSWQGETKRMHLALGQFISENQINKDFMCLSMTDVDGVFKRSDISVIPDYTNGFFFHKGRPYFYTNNKASEQGSVPANISLSTIGRTVDVIWNAVKVEERINTSARTRNFYVAVKKEWEEVGLMSDAPALFLDEKIKKKLDDKIDFFKNNEKWYRDRGIAYKLLIILHGAPGTGKSRISRYVADRLGYSLGTLDSTFNFEEVMRAATKKQIVVSVPDFDTLGLAKSRGKLEDNDEDDGDTPKPQSDNGLNTMLKDFDTNTLGRVLNLFQGDIPVNNLVAVMSTNCIEKVDTALLRRGRCDLLLEIGNLHYSEVNQFYKHHYVMTQDLDEDIYGSIKIKACDVMGFYEDHPFDADRFLEKLKHYVH